MELVDVLHRNKVYTNYVTPIGVDIIDFQTKTMPPCNTCTDQ